MRILDRLARRQRESHQISKIEADAEDRLVTMAARVERATQAVKNVEKTDPVSRHMRYVPRHLAIPQGPNTVGGQNGKSKS